MKQPYVIAPSLLSADFAFLGKEAEKVLTAGADWLHVDVMDNHYVPNLTFGSAVCAALRRFGITAPLDVHLMIEPVDSMVPEFAKAGADLITFHPQASRHVDRTIQLIRAEGCQVGIALNPATSLTVLDYLWDKIDLVLVMSVNPGFGGQSFIPSSLQKIKQLRSLIDQSQRPIRLQVDGGVKVDNVQAITAAGADTLVAGSAIFGSKEYAKTIAAMRKALT